MFRPSLNSKKRITGNCRRRVRSQNPASSGTCNRETSPSENQQLEMRGKKKRGTKVRRENHFFKINLPKART